MSYSEENGQVTLRMSPEDYDLLLVALGSAVGAALQGKGTLGLKVVCALANRINEGNSNYTPYVTGDGKEFRK